MGLVQPSPTFPLPSSSPSASTSSQPVKRRCGRPRRVIIEQLPEQLDITKSAHNQRPVQAEDPIAESLPTPGATPQVSKSHSGSKAYAPVDIPTMGRNKKGKPQKKAHVEPKKKPSIDLLNGAPAEPDEYVFRAIIDDQVWSNGKTVFMVDWEGNDPTTGQPWPQTWEPEENIPESAIETYIAEKQARQRERSVSLSEQTKSTVAKLKGFVNQQSETAVDPPVTSAPALPRSKRRRHDSKVPRNQASPELGERPVKRARNGPDAAADTSIHPSKVSTPVGGILQTPPTVFQSPTSRKRSTRIVHDSDEDGDDEEMEILRSSPLAEKLFGHPEVNPPPEHGASGSPSPTPLPDATMENPSPSPAEVRVPDVVEEAQSSASQIAGGSEAQTESLDDAEAVISADPAVLEARQGISEGMSMTNNHRARSPSHSPPSEQPQQAEAQPAETEPGPSRSPSAASIVPDSRSTPVLLNGAHIIPLPASDSPHEHEVLDRASVGSSKASGASITGSDEFHVMTDAELSHQTELHGQAEAVAQAEAVPDHGIFITEDVTVENADMGGTPLLGETKYSTDPTPALRFQTDIEPTELIDGAPETSLETRSPVPPAGYSLFLRTHLLIPLKLSAAPTLDSDFDGVPLPAEKFREEVAGYRAANALPVTHQLADAGSSGEGLSLSAGTIRAGFNRARERYHALQEQLTQLESERKNVAELPTQKPTSSPELRTHILQVPVVMGTDQVTQYSQILTSSAILRQLGPDPTAGDGEGADRPSHSKIVAIANTLMSGTLHPALCASPPDPVVLTQLYEASSGNANSINKLQLVRACIEALARQVPRGLKVGIVVPADAGKQKHNLELTARHLEKWATRYYCQELGRLEHDLDDEYEEDDRRTEVQLTSTSLEGLSWLAPAVDIVFALGHDFRAEDPAIRSMRTNISSVKDLCPVLAFYTPNSIDHAQLCGAGSGATEMSDDRYEGEDEDSAEDRLLELFKICMLNAQTAGHLTKDQTRFLQQHITSAEADELVRRVVAWCKPNPNLGPLGGAFKPPQGQWTIPSLPLIIGPSTAMITNRTSHARDPSELDASEQSLVDGLARLCTSAQTRLEKIWEDGGYPRDLEAEARRRQLQQPRDGDVSMGEASMQQSSASSPASVSSSSHLVQPNGNSDRNGPEVLSSKNIEKPSSQVASAAPTPGQLSSQAMSPLDGGQFFPNPFSESVTQTQAGSPDGIDPGILDLLATSRAPTPPIEVEQPKRKKDRSSVGGRETGTGSDGNKRPKLQPNAARAGKR